MLNLKNNQTKKMSIQVPDDAIQARPHVVQADKFIQQGALSPTAKRVVFEARGDLFTVPAEKGNARNLTNSPAWRERDPVWSPDGKWIAYLSDRSGEYEIYLRKGDGEGDETRVTTDGDASATRCAGRPTARSCCSPTAGSATSTWISTRRSQSSSTRIP